MDFVQLGEGRGGVKYETMFWSSQTSVHVYLFPVGVVKDGTINISCFQTYVEDVINYKREYKKDKDGIWRNLEEEEAQEGNEGEGKETEEGERRGREED